MVLAQASPELPPLDLRVGQTSTRVAEVCSDPKVAVVLDTGDELGPVRAVGPGQTRCRSADTYVRTSGVVAEIQSSYVVSVIDAPRTIYGPIPAEQADRLGPLGEDVLRAPRAWHDESQRRDGSIGCAITETAFVTFEMFEPSPLVSLIGDAPPRVESVPFSRIVKVEVERGGWLNVWTVDHMVGCTFASNNEDASTFAAMLRRTGRVQ